MPLTINPALAEANPLGLTRSEADMLKSWENMTADQKGEYMHHAKQEDNRDAFLSSIQFNESINSNVFQRLSGGGVQVGGAVRPDALVTIGGIEMTAQQAVDLGLRSSEMIGTQTADLA